MSEDKETKTTIETTPERVVETRTIGATPAPKVETTTVEREDETTTKVENE